MGIMFGTYIILYSVNIIIGNKRNWYLVREIYKIIYAPISQIEHVLRILMLQYRARFDFDNVCYNKHVHVLIVTDIFTNTAG